jgi:hypothetical protein
MTTAKRYRCKYCGLEFPAWLPVMQEPDGPMLLHHLSPTHPAESGRTWPSRSNGAKSGVIPSSLLDNQTTNGYGSGFRDGHQRPE